MGSFSEFRIHGRGGQGVVVAAAVFAEAVFLEGYYARAFSLFGAERRGAPVTAFVRAGREKLMPRCRIYRPGFVAVFDATLQGAALLDGLDDSGILLLNGAEGSPLLHAMTEGFLGATYLVDAAAIARNHDLRIGNVPAVNMVMVGALARVSGMASLDRLLEAVNKRISNRRDDNLKAAADGYNGVKEVVKVG